MNYSKQILVITVLIQSITPDQVSSENIFNVKQSSVLSLEELNEEITREGVEPREVAQLLSKSKQKSKLDTVLNKLSIAEILDLNEQSFSQCSKLKLHERIWTCNKMSANDNLDRYCKFANNISEKFCRDHLDYVLKLNVGTLAVKDKKRIKKLHQKVAAAKNKEKPELLIKIKKYLMSKESDSRRRLVASCKKLDQKMEDIYYLDDKPAQALSNKPDLKSWVDYAEDCKIVLEILK